tara:strand:- start:626 stop:1015 length:390 start_codon:yes stop_codon:yes gene_type:complete
MKNLTINKEILNHAINGMDNVSNDSTYGCDLHNKLFNEDYFIIGYYNAQVFLTNCEDGIFGAIEIIKEYEQNNFGEVNTDFSSSEKVANMYAYIKGEELLSEIKALTGNWDNYLTDENIQEIKNELSNL